MYDDPDLYDALLPVSEEQRSFYVELAQRNAGSVLSICDRSSLRSCSRY